jgi:hypothetical protein
VGRILVNCQARDRDVTQEDGDELCIRHELAIDRNF